MFRATSHSAGDNSGGKHDSPLISPPATGHSTLRKAAYGAIATILLLGLGEVVLRAVSLDLYSENEFFQVNRDINFTNVYDKDRELFWKLKKSITINSEEFSELAYRTNADGFRGRNIPLRTDRLRIVALGNSCTFGWGVHFEDVYTTRLQEKLPGVEVVNCGVPGYSSHQGLTLARRIVSRLQPDIVLIMFGWNDHWPASQGISDREQALPPQWVLSIQNRLSKLELYKLLRKLSLDMMRSDAPKPAFSQVSGLKRVSPLEFEKNLRDIISLAHSEQIEPILLAPPIASLKNYFPGVTHAPFHQLHAEYQGLIRQVAERTETKLLDLQEAFDLRHDLFDSPRDDPVHFNAAGHLLVAEAIATAMRGSGVAEALH